MAEQAYRVVFRITDACASYLIVDYNDDPVQIHVPGIGFTPLVFENVSHADDFAAALRHGRVLRQMEGW